ncbi:MAG: hypothetical protein A2X59_08885, partial [Nitrospirae bacterium GWC2_42_7]
MKKKYLKLFSAVILVLISLLYGLSEKDIPIESENKNGSLIRVEKVHDGDTITAIVENRSEKIRLIGIDTPEMGQRPWGSKAKEYLESLVESSFKTLTIEYDIEHRDKYGRILAYIRTKDGRLINEEMLSSGYALLFTFPPNVKYVDRFISAQKEAQN